MKRQLTELPRNAEEIFNEEEEKQKWSKLFFAFLLIGFKKGIDLALVQGPGKTKPGDVLTPAMKQALAQQAFRHASVAVGTTKEQLQGVIGTAIEEGQSIQQLGKAINDQFKLNSKVRSVRIARTELTRVITDAKVRTLAEEGYTQKEWSTVVDGRERETHAAANGQVVGINDYFRVGGYAAFAPGDDGLPPSESINCRCDVVGAGVPEERKIQLGRAFLRTHGALERHFVVRLRKAFFEQRDRVLAQFPP